MFVSIDPGFNGTGFACWRSKGYRWDRLEAPSSVGVIYVPKEYSKDLEPRATYIGKKIADLNADLYFCEFPSYYDSERGKKPASSGALVKLTYLVGVIHGMCARKPSGFMLVPVVKWKGQLSKETVALRIEKRLGKQKCRDLRIRTHAWDAVGIGLHAKGYF